MPPSTQKEDIEEKEKEVDQVVRNLKSLKQLKFGRNHMGKLRPLLPGAK